MIDIDPIGRTSQDRCSALRPEGIHDTNAMTRCIFTLLKYHSLTVYSQGTTVRWRHIGIYSGWLSSMRVSLFFNSVTKDSSLTISFKEPGMLFQWTGPLKAKDLRPMAVFKLGTFNDIVLWILVILALSFIKSDMQNTISTSFVVRESGSLGIPFHTRTVCTFW